LVNSIIYKFEMSNEYCKFLTSSVCRTWRALGAPVIEL
jgi:hypothetical protein